MSFTILPAAAVLDPVGLVVASLDLLARGGPVMYILLVLSVLAVTIILLKLWQFWRARLNREEFVREAEALLRAGERRRAEELLAATPHPAARLMETVVALASDPGVDAAERDARVGREGARRVRQLETGLRPLELIGNMSPLLGLLGTVVGMISAFAALEAAGAKIHPGLLAGGIWEALLTTAFGLSVALPALTGFYLLDARVEQAHETMQQAAEIALEALGATSETPAGDAERHSEPPLGAAILRATAAS